MSAEHKPNSVLRDFIATWSGPEREKFRDEYDADKAEALAALDSLVEQLETAQSGEQHAHARIAELDEQYEHAVETRRLANLALGQWKQKHDELKEQFENLKLQERANAQAFEDSEREVERLREQLATVQHDYKVAETGCQQLEGIVRELQRKVLWYEDGLKPHELAPNPASEGVSGQAAVHPGSAPSEESSPASEHRGSCRVHYAEAVCTCGASFQDKGQS